MQQKSSDSAPMAGTEHPPHVAACSVANWQPLFEKISIPTISLAIPNDVISYLRADFFILPAECSGPDDTFSGFDGDDGRETCDDDGTTNEAGASGSNSEDADDSDQTEPPTFPEFSELVRQAIADLGGGVFIKTNWHSPKDAFWITAGQTLRCRDISDVYQLLKASSYCKQDIGEPETSSSTSASVDVINPAVNNVRVEQFLNVRRWLEIHPGTEFRCYVRDRRLIGEFKGMRLSGRYLQEANIVYRFVVQRFLRVTGPSSMPTFRHRSATSSTTSVRRLRSTSNTSSVSAIVSEEKLM